MNFDIKRKKAFDGKIDSGRMRLVKIAAVILTVIIAGVLLTGCAANLKNSSFESGNGEKRASAVSI